MTTRLGVLAAALAMAVLLGGCASQTIRPPRPFSTERLKGQLRLDSEIARYVDAYYRAADGDAAVLTAVQTRELPRALIDRTIGKLEKLAADFERARWASDDAVENFAEFKKAAEATTDCLTKLGPQGDPAEREEIRVVLEDNILVLRRFALVPDADNQQIPDRVVGILADLQAATRDDTESTREERIVALRTKVEELINLARIGASGIDSLTKAAGGLDNTINRLRDLLDGNGDAPDQAEIRSTLVQLETEIRELSSNSSSVATAISNASVGTINATATLGQINLLIRELRKLERDVPSVYIPKSQEGIRQIIVSKTMILIDLNYQDFVEDFATFKKRGDTAAEIGVVSANAVAALVGPLGTSQAISAGAGVLAASQTSFNKNFFYEKTVPVLIASMEAQRLKIRQQITSNAGLGVEVYPLEAALSDLNQYYAAGTFEGALELIAQEAGKTQSKAEEEFKKRYEDARKDINAAIARQQAWVDYIGDDAARHTSAIETLRASYWAADKASRRKRISDTLVAYRPRNLSNEFKFEQAEIDRFGDVDPLMEFGAGVTDKTIIDVFSELVENNEAKNVSRLGTALQQFGAAPPN